MASALRRWTHASTALVLFLPRFLGWPFTRWILIACVLVWGVVEFGRIRSPGVRVFVSRVMPVFRAHETTRPSGAFWLVVGHAVCSWYPPGAATVGILAGSLADPAAAWVGGAMGRGGAKTWAGTTAACVVAGGLGVMLGLSWGAAGAVGAVVGVVERYPGPVDDNLVVGPAAGIVSLLLR